ncbi:hypothetical protein AMV009 [Betaentomopoxvirus amoorei]|uniref:AMV009 n=1 Tax=Amsacta moorei entomopoxvirus TaxID=28321 RepID=Q9EN37_AMEPV|nr:hypothetical protein AMV009 [Amsacta moorei entomopoxvirus]AAG02715.1 AMV009 [Amsacta moorei entomopoxvirus]
MCVNLNIISNKTCINSSHSLYNFLFLKIIISLDKLLNLFIKSKSLLGIIIYNIFILLHKNNYSTVIFILSLYSLEKFNFINKIFLSLLYINPHRSFIIFDFFVMNNSLSIYLKFLLTIILL